MYDEFSANGLRCRNSLGNPTVFDLGTLATEDGRGAVYGRIIIPLGPRPQRFDCSEFFEMEMKRQSLEIQMLEQQMYRLPD